jgi:dTMP kinase
VSWSPIRPGCGDPDVSGRLIVFEGTYSCGKSTQLQAVRDLLAARGDEPVLTEWNSSDLLAEFMLEQRMRGTLSPRLLYLLELADFTRRYETVIGPALLSGRTVLADRYVQTGIVRAAVRGVPEAYCAAGYSFARPADLTLYFDCPPATTLRRRKQKGQSIAGYVSGEDFLTGHRSSDEAFVAYQQALDEHYHRLLPPASAIIDAERDITEVRAAVAAALSGPFPDLYGGDSGHSDLRPHGGGGRVAGAGRRVGASGG